MYSKPDIGMWFTAKISNVWAQTRPALYSGLGQSDVLSPVTVIFKVLFCYLSVALVESNSRPAGHQLVNTYMTNRNADPMDLVELAKQVQKVRSKEETCPISRNFKKKFMDQ